MIRGIALVGVGFVLGYSRGLKQNTDFLDKVEDMAKRLDTFLEEAKVDTGPEDIEGSVSNAEPKKDLHHVREELDQEFEAGPRRTERSLGDEGDGTDTLNPDSSTRGESS